MKPKVLVLDEPTAGLDPQGRDDILDQIARLHKETDMTCKFWYLIVWKILPVNVDRIIVMNHGEKMFEWGAEKQYLHIIKSWIRFGTCAPQDDVY